MMVNLNASKLIGLSVVAALAVAACGSDDSPDFGASSVPATDAPAASADEATDDPVTLGFAIGETGFMLPYDVPARIVAQMAIDDINADGGAGGRQFDLITSDTKSDPALGGTAAADVISNGADIVITSCDFDMGAPAALVAQEKGLLAFATCAASTDFGPTGIGPLAFTMATAAPAEGASMAEWAYNEKEWKTAYVILDDTIDFTKQTTFGFEERFKELGGEIVGSTSFKQEDASIATQINEIKAASPAPDVIWLTSYNPGLASALKQIRAAGLDMPIVSDEDMDGDYWKDAVPNVSDVYYATYASIYGDDPDPALNALVDRYRDQEGEIPDTALFLTGYSMVQAIAEAVERTGGDVDGAKLQAALETFSNEPFLLPTSFTADQHISFSRTLRILEIQDGTTTFLTVHDPENVPVP